MHKKQQRGSAVVEFVLTGIPLLFITIGIFWMSLGMWHFHTLQYASKVTAAYISTHGASYVSAGGTSIKVKDVANVLAAQAVGVTPSAITATFTAGNTTKTCRLDLCQADSTTVWPPTTDNTTGTDIKVKAVYTFLSAFAMWTPGNSAVSFANSYALSGYSHQQILF